MRYKYHSFRHAGVIFQEAEFIAQFNELTDIVNGITDEDLIERHNSYGAEDIELTPKSISRAINGLFRDRFVAAGWSNESPIFQNTRYQGETWRLDFAKGDVSIEIAFNHSTVIAWNLLKPVLASELNHVEKAIQTKIGVLITATEALKRSGGFDSAIGTFENFVKHLPPLNNVLTVPLFIIGLEPPESFSIEHHRHAPRKLIGRVVMREDPPKLIPPHELEF